MEAKQFSRFTPVPGLPDSHIVFLPGDVSLDLFEALKRGTRVMKPRAKTVSIQATGKYINTPAIETSKEKVARVKRELLDAGITFYGLMKAESRYLPKILRQDEHIEAIVYGQHHSSSVMLAATDERILFLDKKPMALFLDEVSYEVVSGIEFEIHTLTATLILHTPVKNYDIRYANLHCAEKFARHIEEQRLARAKREEKTAKVEQEREEKLAAFKKIRPYELQEDMAGYYWLPTDDDEEVRRLRALGR